MSQSPTGTIIRPDNSVQASTTSTNGNVCTYDGATGKLIKDIGLVVTGTNTGDQPLFQTIAVSGQSDVVADTITDTLTLVEANGIVITTDAGTDTITFTGGNNFGTVAVSGQTDAAATVASDTLTLVSGTNTTLTIAGNAVTVNGSGMALGAVQSKINTSATTPSDATGTATNIVVNNSGAEANTITTGSNSGFTATAATRPSIQYDTTGTMTVIATMWWNGAATSPYYRMYLYVGGTEVSRIDFINNASYYQPVSISWTGSYTASQEIKLMLGQTNGSVKVTTCVDYVINCSFLKDNV